MASLELQNEIYRVDFLHEGKKHSYSLKTGNAKDADRMGAVEDILIRVAQGYITVPEDTNIVAVLKNGGTDTLSEIRNGPILSLCNKPVTI